MKTAIAMCLLLVSLPVCAQYGPPAKDLEDAQFFMRELQRQLGPAATEARDRAQVFTTVARAANKLVGREPATEISDAIAILDDFVERRRRGGNELSRDNEQTISSVRKELELAQPPYAIPALRERLHHEFVHTLQRQVLEDLNRVKRLQGEWEMFVSRFLEPVEKETMSGVTLAAREPGQ